MVESRKESEHKLKSLQQEITAASRLTPEDIARMERELQVLQQQVGRISHAWSMSCKCCSSRRDGVGVEMRVGTAG